MNKDSWLTFAQEHNASANFNATLLSGSESYTLVAMHFFSDIPIPKTVLLDTKRAHGKFVSDHFSGLRELFESGIELNPWSAVILEKSRKFARLHFIDSEELIKKMIEMTEKKGRRSSKKYRPIPFKATMIEVNDDDDIKI